MYSGGVMPGRRAGSGVGKYNAKSPKQGSKRFNSNTKMFLFAHLVILFLYGPWIHLKGKQQQNAFTSFMKKKQVHTEN